MPEPGPEVFVAHMSVPDLAREIGNAIMATGGVPPLTAEGFADMPEDLQAGLNEAAYAAIRYVMRHLAEAGVASEVLPEPGDPSVLQ